MKRIFISFVLAIIIIQSLAGCSGAHGTTSTDLTPAESPSQPRQEVVLTMGSWRVEDREQMSHILAKFHEKYPYITIQYDPTPAPDYDAALVAQLKAGTGPDLFYLRSFSVSRSLYEQGFIEPLTGLPGLEENFSLETLAPWSSESGEKYGVPFIATSHGIYYNEDIFKALGLPVPTTWEQLLATAQKIKDAGYIPFANAYGDSWTLGELVFMNIAPNFIGGFDGRMAYLNGKRCFNDADMVSAFQAVRDLGPFLSPDQAMLTYTDSQQLFLQGKAAMFFDGSWEIPFFTKANPPFAWSVFAPPPPAGKAPYITFHLDAGMGMNASTKHKEEALLFLQWMTTREFAEEIGNELPGFFPMNNQPPTLSNVQANTFLSLNNGRGTDVRLAWEKLRDGSPSAYDLIVQGAIEVITRSKTPQEAADELQNGLAQWYQPAQTCK